jgi:hypothetical protein
MSVISEHEMNDVSTSSRMQDTTVSSGSLEAMEVEIQQLPPADHGKQAYLVLAGCSLIQAPVWGKAVLA